MYACNFCLQCICNKSVLLYHRQALELVTCDNNSIECSTSTCVECRILKSICGEHTNQKHPVLEVATARIYPPASHKLSVLLRSSQLVSRVMHCCFSSEPWMRLSEQHWWQARVDRVRALRASDNTILLRMLHNRPRSAQRTCSA